MTRSPLTSIDASNALTHLSITLSRIQYGITLCGIAEPKPADDFPNSTKSLQIIANNVMRVIKPGKSNIREWGAQKLFQELKFLSIYQLIIKSKLLEI